MSIEEIQLKLNQLRGADVTLQYFTASHEHLRLRVEDNAGNIIFLVCEGCIDLSLPTLWQNSSIIITKNRDEKIPARYQVIDQNNHIKIICDLVLIWS